MSSATAVSPTTNRRPTAREVMHALLPGGDVRGHGGLQRHRVHAGVVQGLGRPLHEREGILVASRRVAAGGHGLDGGGAQPGRAGGGQQRAAHGGLAHLGIGAGHEQDPAHALQSSPNTTS